MNKKYALCIGNNFPGTNAELRGCQNDAADWGDLFGSENYDSEVIFEATKAVAVDRLKAMVAEAGFGDRIVFQVSSHGTWTYDRDGDEVDQRDEALCMVDFMQGGLLLDDEMDLLLSASRRGVGKLILADTCHSGTVNRFLAPMPKGAKPRFLSPTNFMNISEEQAVELEERVGTAPRPTSSLISGCADEEYSYDASFGGRPNGAFTYYAIQSYQSGMSLKNWHAAIRTKLPVGWYKQTPQLTVQSSYRKYLKAL